MAEIAYAVCPGGKDKKVKFCCPDLVHDLDKIDRMVGGQQYVACLEQIERLDQKHPGRACLVTLKAQLERQLGLTAQAAETLRPLTEVERDNPVVLAEQLRLLSEQPSIAFVELVELLQRMLETAPWPLPPSVRNAVATSANLLAGGGRLVAARACLMLLLNSNPQDRAALEGLVRLSMAARGVWNGLDVGFDPAPADASWAAEHDALEEDVVRGRWRKAERALAALVERVPDAAVAWHNLVLVRLALTDDVGAVAAARRLAALDIPLDEAVEAEALAQTYDRGNAEWMTQAQIDFPLSDLEAAMARLIAHPQAEQEGVSAEEYDEGHPPPRFAYHLLDRPLPAADADVAWEQAPRLLGEVLLFGRETDREARLELFAVEDGSLDAARHLVAECCGDAVGPPGEPQPMGKRLLLQHLLEPRFVLPAGSNPDAARRLADDWRSHAVLTEIPQAPLKLFDGRSLAEAAADPAYRVRALAVVLQIELSGGGAGMADLCQRLRERLALPAPQPLAPGPDGLDGVSDPQLVRLDPAGLADEEVALAYRRAASAGLADAARRFAGMLVERPSAEGPLRLEALGLLVDLAPTADEAMEHVERGRQQAVTLGQSSGPWDLRELHLRLQRNEPEHIGRLLDHLLREHGREPEIREEVFRILTALGLINPDGTPARRAEPALAGAGDADAGKIWTPEQPRGEPAKSGLWLPGME